MNLAQYEVLGQSWLREDPVPPGRLSFQSSRTGFGDRVRDANPALRAGLCSDAPCGANNSETTGAKFPPQVSRTPQRGIRAAFVAMAVSAG